MKPLNLALVVLGVFCGAPLYADSTVVFNEIMYHPPTNEAEMEWVELHNQMSVDMDISHWSLAGGITYAFAERTIVPGNGYLVVAASPATLMAAAGITNVLGPFSGRLSNSGETLQLLNNNQRVMDRLTYGMDGDWPVAPDGSGVSLAKLNPNGATADASNWCASAQVGGTPGAENFPVVTPTVIQTTLVDIQGSWKFNDTGADLGTTWRDTNYNDSAWPSGLSLFYRGSASLPAATNTLLASGRITYYFRTRFAYTGDLSAVQLQLRPLIDDGAVFYLNGAEIGRFNMPSGAISNSTLASAPVATASYGDVLVLPTDHLLLGANVLAAEVHQARSIVAYPQAVLNSAPVAYWRLGESASPALDSASAAGSPQAGAQNGVYTGFAATNLAQAGPRPGDIVGSQTVAGFEINNFAPRFAGNNDGGDDVVTIADSGVLNFSTNRTFSLEAWVNGAITQESGAAIVCKGYGGGGEQYALDVQNGVFRFFIRDNGSPPAATTTSAAFGPNGAWQHLAAVYDQAGGIMRLYINGALAASNTPRATLLNTNHEVSIGARQGNNTSPYNLNFDGRIDEVAIYNRALATNEITAHFNAAFDSSPSAPADTNDVVFGLQFTSFQTLPLPVLPKLAFNELASATNTFWLELINYGATNADLTGCTITRFRSGSTNDDYVFPVQSLAAGACLQLTKPIMGFGADPSDKFILYASGRTNVLDAVLADALLRGRYPDGTGPWLYPNVATPGASNSFAFHNEIVINEIMYHHWVASGSNDSPEAWIELYNRSTNSVNLTGWQLAGGIQYTFPAGETIAPGAYLVVASEVAYMTSLHPGLNVVGPFAGKLSKSSDWIVLNDANNNPANQVHYFDSGRWPEYADGGGSSLELRDPRADNSKPEAWAASNEGAKSTWQTYTYRGVAQTSMAGLPTLWNELNLGLIDGAGEVLLDDISVVENPDTTRVQFIQNGSFNDGVGAHWRFRGNHRHSRVEPEPGNPGNFVLHLIATGPTEYTGNQIETTFTNGLSVVDGRTYEISFRAKWLAGKSLLNTRLYFDRLARTTQLAVPASNGTPGGPNSAYVTNLGPVYSNLRHQPVVPNAGDPVTISVTAEDPDGVSLVKLWYAVGGGAWNSLAMTNPAGGSYAATLPGQAAGMLVQFYIEGHDGSNTVSCFPAGGTNSRALYRVNDGQATTAPPRNFRVLMLPADANFMHADTNVLSNESLGCTVLDNEQEVFYDVGVRLKGSFVGRNVARVGFTIDFDPSRLFRGVFDTVAIDRSQGTSIGQAEILTKHMASHAGRIPNMYDDLVHFIAPRTQDTSQAQLRMAAYNSIYLDSQFQNGSDGPMYEIESPRYSGATADGTVEGVKLPGPGNSSGYDNPDINNYGDDLETYRWWLLQANNRTEDDFSHIIPMSKAFGLTGTNLDVQTQALMDVDEWMRTFAFESLAGPTDAYFTGSNNHNFRLYVRPADQKVLAMPWDWDSSFNRSTSGSLVGGANLAKIVNLPNNLRAYYGHLYDIISTTFNTTYMARWTAHYGSLANQDFSSILSYIGSRATYVLGQLPTTAPFAITSNNGNNFLTNTSQATLTGTAPIQVKTIQINGVTYALNWTTLTNWSLVLPLRSGTNSLVFQGFDAQDTALTNATDTLTITNLGPGVPLPVLINEWMADNAGPDGFADPLDGLFKNWFELYNPNPDPVNLSGFYLTDDLALPTQWRIPTNSLIPGRGFLLVWADNKTNLNGLSTNGDLHAAFKLNKDGEAIGLFAPDGVAAQSAVTFGPQMQNVSQGRFPDGNADAVYFMTDFTPRSANILPSLQFTQISVTNGLVVLEWQAIPAQSYRLQYQTNLTHAWIDLAPDIVAGGKFVRSTNALSPAGQRFFRVLRVD